MTFFFVETWKLHPNLDHLLSREYIGLTFIASFVLTVTFKDQGYRRPFFNPNRGKKKKKDVALSRFLIIIHEIKMRQALCTFYSQKIIKNYTNQMAH